MRLEARATPSKIMVIGSPLLAVAITVALAVVLFSVLGKDPVRALGVFFWEPIKNVYGWSELGVKATPLALCALGLALAYRANVWNIGADGQLLAGAIAASGVALLATPATGKALLPIVLLAGIAGGMLWAAIVAFLRDRYNANEILVSLMLVYVAYFLLAYLVFGPWKDPQGFNFPQTQRFVREVSVPILIPGTRLHIGAIVTLLAAIGMAIFMFRTFAGFKLQVGGLAPAAARYAGFSSRSALWSALLVSGGFAGLAGAFEAVGPLGQLTPHVSPGYGFAAIIVAFVGRLHPIGIVFAALLMAMLYIGGELSQSRLGLPKALTGVFQGTLLLALLACDTLIHYRVRWRR
jgi:general nucleoside transport system permease protein